MVSPLAPKGGFPDLPIVEGVRFAAIEAGVRYKGRVDVMLAELAPGTIVTGTFTRSKTRAAPVLDCQAKLGGASHEGAAFLVNAGNANAFTGVAGIESVSAIAKAVSETLGVPEERVFTSSTGVIGEPLPHKRVTEVLTDLQASLDPASIGSAAKAIMTTDTFPKGAGRTVKVGSKTVSVAGIAKGSGMIAPDMATMLVYVFTDAQISQADLQRLVSRHCDVTFNCIWAVKEIVPGCHLVKLGTMGEYGTPNIESEAGWIDITHKGRSDKFLFPRAAGSLYHTTKVLDTDLLWFYVRTHGLRVTDLMQGPVYGGAIVPGAFCP